MAGSQEIEKKKEEKKNKLILVTARTGDSGRKSREPSSTSSHPMEKGGANRAKGFPLSGGMPSKEKRARPALLH